MDSAPQRMNRTRRTDTFFAQCSRWGNVHAGQSQVCYAKVACAMSHDGGCRLVIALALLSVVPVTLGTGPSCVIADGTDAPRLHGLLGSRVAPSHYLLACGLRFLVGGFLRK